MNGKTEKDMTNFNWVKERFSCSPSKVFETLKLQAQEDVNVRNSLRPKNADYGFSVVVSGTSFTVLKEGNNLHESVIFSLTEKGITVRDKNDKPMFEATLTLNDEGECRVKINGQEREFWQMRKTALEGLFFIT